MSWSLGEAVPIDARPLLAADDPHVKASLDTFQTYLKDNAVDVSKTKLTLGRELVIDPATEKSTDAEANRLFMEILTARNDPEGTLRRMNEAGVLGKFVPDFGRVVALRHGRSVSSGVLGSFALRAQ